MLLLLLLLLLWIAAQGITGSKTIARMMHGINRERLDFETPYLLLLLPVATTAPYRLAMMEGGGQAGGMPKVGGYDLHTGPACSLPYTIPNALKPRRRLLLLLHGGGGVSGS